MYNKVKSIGKKIIKNCLCHFHKTPDTSVTTPETSVLSPGTTVLPGTPYQKYLLPLDYLPSRDYQSRWGNTHAPHSGLIELFDKQRASYEKIFQEMSNLKSFYEKIDKNFDSHSSEPGWLGGCMNAIDLALIYYFITKLKPQKYVEIGSGMSTLFAARAKRDHKLSTQIISVDPNPRCFVDAVCDKVIRDGLETTDLSIFLELNQNDIVFMDGSHRSFMNSDVTVFMLDVLPLLKPGVVIHFHDICLPYDYPQSFANWYWNEQYLLAVYLMAMGEEKVKILMPAQYMSYSTELKKNLTPVFKGLLEDENVWQNGGSLWFTKK